MIINQSKIQLLLELQNDSIIVQRHEVQSV